jgi:hypothetical protein
MQLAKTRAIVSGVRLFRISSTISKSLLISLTDQEENSPLSHAKRKKSDGAMSRLKVLWTKRSRCNFSIRAKFRFDVSGRALSIWSNGYGQCFFFWPA